MPDSYQTQSEQDLLLDNAPSATVPNPAMRHQVNETEAEIQNLRQKRIELEERKRALELLSQRQEEYAGQRDRICKLQSEALLVLEQEVADAQSREEYLTQLGEVIARHLDVLRHYDPDNWDDDQVESELERAELALVDAREEYQRFEARDNGSGGSSLFGVNKSRVRHFAEGTGTFLSWMKMGLAFSLPVMIFVVTLFAIWRITS